MSLIPGRSWRSLVRSDNKTRSGRGRVAAAAHVAAEALEGRRLFNAAPTNLAAALTSATINEGSFATLSGSFVSPDPESQSHNVVIDWQDGTRSTVTSAGAGTISFSATHRYLDNGTYSISTTVTDQGGLSAGPDVEPITVDNVRPSLSALTLLTPSVNEGSNGSMVVRFTDPGALDTFDTVINWGDGTTITYNNMISGQAYTHTYVDGPAVRNFSVSVTDKDGGETNPFSFRITVNNVSPRSVAATVPAGLPVPNVPFTLSGSFVDPGTADPHTVTIDWGDSSATQTLGVLPAGVTTFAAVHTYVDESPHAVKITVNDEIPPADPATYTGTLTTTIAAHYPPTGLQANVVANVVENGVATVTGSFVDPGLPNSHAVSITWGDNTQSTVSLATGVTTFTATHQYLDDGPSPGNGTTSDVLPIGITLVDDLLSSISVGRSITVSNVAPSALSLTASPTSVNEGGTITFSGGFTDPGTLDAHNVTVNWADGSAPQVVSLAAGVNAFSVEHTFLDADAPTDLTTVTATVSDDDGATSSPATTTVSIINVAPTATPQTNSGLTYGTAATASLTSPQDIQADADAGFRYAFALDTDTTGAATYATAGVAASADFGVVNAGSHTVYARIFDKDGGSTLYTSPLEVKKAAATVVVAPYAVTYDGTPHSATFTSITGVNGEFGSAVGTVTLVSTHTDAGDYTDSWTFTATSNYQDIASTPIQDTIAKADALIAVTGGTFNYNAAAHPATASATGVETPTPQDLTALLSLAYKNLATNAVSTAAPSLPGTYAVLVGLAGNTNYASVPLKDSGQTITITGTTPVFGVLSTPTIIVGTATTTISGRISSPAGIPPGSVLITVGGVTVSAPIKIGGYFSAVVATAKLPVGVSTVQYAYAGSSNFIPASTTSKLTVTNAIKVLFKNQTAYKIGTTIPVSFEVENASGKDIPSATRTATATGIALVTTPKLIKPLPAGSSPGGVFTPSADRSRFTLSLKTTGLSAGQYLLYFTIGGDPVPHALTFILKT